MVQDDGGNKTGRSNIINNIQYILRKNNGRNYRDRDTEVRIYTRPQLNLKFADDIDMKEVNRNKLQGNMNACKKSGRSMQQG